MIAQLALAASSIAISVGTPLLQQCAPASEPVPAPTCRNSHNIGTKYVYGVEVQIGVGYCEPNGAGQVRAVAACWNGVAGQYTWREGEWRTKVDDVDLFVHVHCNTQYPLLLPDTLYVETV